MAVRVGAGSIAQSQIVREQTHPNPGGVAVRFAALHALLAVHKAELGSQAAVSQALDKVAAVDRGLVTELVYAALRRQRSLDRWIAQASARGLVGMDDTLLVALRLGALQLADMPRIPSFAAVDATVQACKQLDGASKATVGFVHAVLRNLARQAQQGGRPDDADLPPWIAQRVADLAADTASDPVALLAAFCRAAPLHLQVLGHGDQLRQRCDQLCEAGVLGAALPVPGAFVAAGPQALQHAQFGVTFLAMDASSAAVVRWLDPQPGWRVLDLCAGRGVKAALLASCGASVTAVDVSAAKLVHAAALAEATGAPLYATHAADATAELPCDRESFDAVLVDAPCTGLGTLRRRPEIRHRRRAADLVELTIIQTQLADRAVEMVKPGGVIMLATCSFAREEGPLWAAAVQQRHPHLRRSSENPPWVQPLLDADGALRTLPTAFGGDAFFAARLTAGPG